MIAGALRALGFSGAAIINWRDWVVEDALPSVPEADVALIPFSKTTFTLMGFVTSRLTTTAAR